MTSPVVFNKAEIGGLELAYLEAGQGSPVLFLHGGGATDYRTWEDQVESFSPRYHAIAYSRRGHFPNPSIPSDLQPVSTETHGRDLHDLIEALKMDRVTLVATSYGGDIAL